MCDFATGLSRQLYGLTMPSERPIFDSSLDIKTLLKLEPISKEATRVEVSSNYIFTSIETGTSWRFKTNNPKLILVGNPAYGAEPYRKCLSKNLIESKLIEERAGFNK